MDKHLDAFFAENKYNEWFFAAKSHIQGDKTPSLFLILIFMIIDYSRFKNEDVYPSRESLINLLKEARKVNKLNIKILADGTWNKDCFFDFCRGVVHKYDSYNKNRTYKSFEDFKNDILLIHDELTNNKIDSNKKVFPLFDDVVGLEEAKEVIRTRVIEPSLHRDVFDKYGVQVGGGVLLFGLPGTGKTMFAQAVANEINGHFINIKSSDVKSKWFGETETRIKEIFEEAQKYEVAVIFFDEFEAIGTTRDKQSDITASTVVPELLNHLQGFQKIKNITLVIAATNRPWDIDSALLRPGRLDSLVYVDLPNKEARFMMFKKYLSKVRIEDDIVDYLSNYTNGFNGSDIKNISDKLVRIVIEKEIQGEPDYEITFEDCVGVLKGSKSSVSIKDVQKMQYFLESQR